MINAQAFMAAISDYVREESQYRLALARDSYGASWHNLREAEDNLLDKLNNLNAELERLENLAVSAGELALSASKTAGQAILPHTFIGPGSDWYGQGQVTTQPGINWNVNEIIKEIKDLKIGMTVEQPEI
jgi:hypothetical protein